MSFNLGSSPDTSILVDDDSASEHGSEVFHTALENSIVPKQEDVEVEMQIDELKMSVDNPFIGDELDRDVSMVAQPEDNQFVAAEIDSWKEDCFKRDVICGTPAINEEEGERRFVYWNPLPSVIEEQESPFLFYPSSIVPPASPPPSTENDVIVLSDQESEVEAMVEEVTPDLPVAVEKPAPRKRKRAAPKTPRLPPASIYRYPAGRMTAKEFIAANNTFHLVIEQEGTPGRIGRALLEFDLKPREFSTGSYGWSGACQGGLPTEKGMVQIRCSVNLVVKGSNKAHASE